MGKFLMDELMAKHPESVASLVSSFQKVLGLEPRITWNNLSKRLCSEFDSEMAVYKYCCVGSGGGSGLGQMTWSGWEALTIRLQVSPLDAKLLWVQLEPSEIGRVEFAS